MATMEVSDLTKANITLKSQVASVVYGVFHEYGIKLGEVNSIIDGIVDLVNNGFEKASNIIWSIDSKDNISLNNVNRRIKC